MKKILVAAITYVVFFSVPATANNNRSLADLTSKCPQKIRTEFYKNLFFVNGFLAAIKAEGLEKCASSDAADILGDRLASFRKNVNKDYRNYDCVCNKYGRLGCKGTKEDSICDTFTCWGDCDYAEKKYSFSERYMHSSYLFGKMPEKTALEFIGSLNLSKGRVTQITVNRDLMKYLNGKEISEMIAVLMGAHWRTAERARAMLNYMANCGKVGKEHAPSEKRAGDMKRKYKELFGGLKLRFGRYDNETLLDFWNIYKTLISSTGEREYLSKAETVFKNLAMRGVQKKKCGKAASGTCVEELFELYMRLGESFGAKRLKKEYPGILKNRIIPER